MKKLVLAASALFILFMLSAGVCAQRSTRIKFKRGSNRAVVTGTLNGFNSKRTFVIRVLKGQRMTTESAGDNPITVSVEAPKGSTYEQDMAADCHDRNEVFPTAPGDYRITVTECQKADRWKGRFKMVVDVR